jgi:hypothetical protein
MRRLFVYALLVVAISLSSVLAIRWATSPSPAPEVLLTRSDNPDFGPSALPGGALEIDLDRGCVLLSGHPVVWPKGTTLTSDPPLVRFPGGLTARPGDVVRGGGGGGYAWQLRGTTIGIDGDLERAVDCVRPHTEVIVFNPEAAMTVAPRMLVTHAINVSETDPGTVLRGRLDIDADRECILVGGRVVLWPNGTRISEPPDELVYLPGGDTMRTGDIVRGRGWRMPPTRLNRRSLWIEGDLDRALACAGAGDQVLVFRAPGTRMTVSRG